jgi:hypothetical protein
VILYETGDCARNIGFFERGDLIGRQPYIHRCDRIIQVVQPGRADDRCGDDRLRQNPCQRDLGARDAACVGDLSDTVDDFPVGLLGLATGELPRIPMRVGGWDGPQQDDEVGTDLRFKLGKGIVVQIRSKDELGPDELDRRLKLITAQKEALTE